jgi:RNA polymerase primary sigma factor
MKKARQEKKVTLADDENLIGLYIKDISRYPMMDRDEEAATAEKAAKGDKAATTRLVNANLRFVIMVAKKYQGHGLSLPDLISEGNIGLLEAIKHFDVKKGNRFISYAMWWIRQAILKAISEKTRMIRLPSNKVNESLAVNKSAGMIAELTSTKEDEAREVGLMLDMEPEKVAKLMKIRNEPVSLDTPLYADSKRPDTVGDIIEDNLHDAPEDITYKDLLHTEIERVLGSLDEKEAAILRCRYGIDDDEPLSLQEIGDKFNISKERVRQIEQKALKHLRLPVRSKRLKQYVA